MGLIKYIASGDSRRSLKKLRKTARLVEELEPKYQAMSDAELRGRSTAFSTISTNPSST